MTDIPLRADCTRCAALCCVGLAFDSSDMFAIDKPAGVACPNLDAAHRCTIHADLQQRGFAGCVHFDCLGAGQRVTQELFEGRSWQDDPALVRPMTDAFRVMRQVHELLSLLQTTESLPLNVEQVARRGELQQALRPVAGWNRNTLTQFERGNVAPETKAFLLTLREHVRDNRGA